MNKPVSLLEFAYEKIKDDIMHGKYTPGEKISIEKIAQNFNMSLTPVKEALNRLASEGFIEAIPRHGMVLKSLSVKDIEDMLNVRKMIEMYSAKLAVVNVRKHPEMIRRMKELLPLLETVGDREYIEATKFEQEFHGLLVKLTENNRLINMYETLLGVGFAFYVYSIGNFPLARSREAYREHVQMYEHLLEGNGDALSDLMGKHMQATIELLEDLISKDEAHRFKVD
ncbi:MAG: GntR family transcriptional regulator [Candidatus Hydrogenedentales bacterium]